MFINALIRRRVGNKGIKCCGAENIYKNKNRKLSNINNVVEGK